MGARGQLFCHKESGSLASWIPDQSRLTTVPVVNVLTAVYVSLIPQLMTAIAATSANPTTMAPPDVQNTGDWRPVAKASGMKLTVIKHKLVLCYLTRFVWEVLLEDLA